MNSSKRFASLLTAFSLVTALGACAEDDDDTGATGMDTEAGTGTGTDSTTTDGSTTEDMDTMMGSDDTTNGTDTDTTGTDTTDGMDETAGMESSSGGELGNIVEIAQATPELSTLVTAVVTAGLDDDLADPDGTFTVFAPTDAAFEAALTDLGVSAEDLLGNEALLTAILQYHVLASEVFAADITGPAAVDSLNYTMFVAPDGDTVSINGGSEGSGATVTAADVMASNGVVHLVDYVLLPPDIVTLAQYATDAGVADFSTLLTAAGTAGIAGDLSYDILSSTLPADDADLITVFAPPNEAFPENLPTGAALEQILEYHVLGGGVASTDLADGPVATSAETSFGVNELGWGLSFYVSVTDDAVLINGGSGDEATNFGANVAVADLVAVNGYVHVVDEVLVPIDIVEMAQVAGLSTLVGSILAVDEAAGVDDPIIADVLSTEPAAFDDAFTVFAPVDQAFTDEAVGDVTDLDAVRGVLLEHVVGEPYVAEAIAGGATLTSLGGTELVFTLDPLTVAAGVDDTAEGISLTDIGASNGVIHLLDGVIGFEPAN